MLRFMLYVGMVLSIKISAKTLQNIHNHKLYVHIDGARVVVGGAGVVQNKPRLVREHVFVCKTYPFYGCSIGFLNYSDSFILFVFHFIISDFCTTPAPPTTTLAPSMCTYNL
jgi:hypothetical protein